MSFGFGVGDFITVSTLTLKLYRSFKGAPGEFQELSRQLESLHIVLADLNDQIHNPNSLLNLDGTTRHAELNTIHDNLVQTMEELEDIHERHQRMGRIAWSRFKLGLRDLATLRAKLTVQITTLNGFMGSLTLGALGRMEPMLQRIYELLEERVTGNRVMAQTILSAASCPDDSGAWDRMNMELRTEGIPEDYLRQNQAQVREIAQSVVDANYLHDDDFSAGNNTEDNTIYADDSISQAGTDIYSSIATTESRPGDSSNLGHRVSAPRLSTSAWLRSLTPEQEATRTLLLEHGIDLLKDGTKTGLQKLWGTIRVHDSTLFLSIAEKAWNWVVKNNNMSAAKLVLSRYGQLELSKLYPASEGKWDIVKLCVTMSDHPNETGLCHFAAKDNRTDILQLLAERGFSLQHEGWKDVPINIHDIIDSGYANNFGGTYPIQVATHYGAIDVVKLFLDHGLSFNIHADTKYYQSPLHWVCSARETTCPDRIKKDLISLFCNRGAQVDAVSYQNGMTPLQLALNERSPLATKALLEHGARIVLDTPKHRGGQISHLHEAARDDKPIFIELLLAHGAAINYCQGRYTVTAIMAACSMRHWKTAKYLKERGASLNGVSEKHLQHIASLPPTIFPLEEQKILDSLRYLRR